MDRALSHPHQSGSTHQYEHFRKKKTKEEIFLLCSRNEYSFFLAKGLNKQRMSTESSARAHHE